MPVTRLDFATLHLRDALDLAILIEQEAQERYTEFADLLETHHTVEAAAFFRTMADYERQHAADLNARRTERFGDAPRTMSSAQIFDVEAPDYDAIRTYMGRRAALQVALVAEEKARDFFAAALPHVTDNEVKHLFAELRDEEIQHHDKVLGELAKLPRDPITSLDDPSDPPVAID
jgi:rubrerythrin